MDMVQSEDEDLDAQETQSEVQQILTSMLNQQFNDDTNLKHKNTSGGMPHGTPMPADSMNVTFTNANSRILDQPSNQESRTVPQPFVPCQAEPVLAQIPALGSLQDLPWNSNSFQNVSFTNFDFESSASTMPSVSPPMSHWRTRLSMCPTQPHLIQFRLSPYHTQ